MSSKETLPRTARDLLRMAREFLARKGVVEARLEAELLAAHALGLTRLQLFMQLDRPLSGPEIDAARDLLVRRGRREPVAYIVGAREFYSRSFRVGPGVLIPRPETELLVDRAREIARELRAEGDGAPVPLRALDVGTGSGCLAVTLALEVAGADVLAIDLSPEALAYARENAEALGAAIELVLGDARVVLAELAREGRRFDLIASNPPYVGADERAGLAPEVREHEPALALFAPEGDRDHWVRELVAAARGLLAPSGVLLVELGAGQAPSAAGLARAGGFDVRLHPDLAGVERVLEARARAR